MRSTFTRIHICSNRARPSPHVYGLTATHTSIPACKHLHVSARPVCLSFSTRQQDSGSPAPLPAGERGLGAPALGAAAPARGVSAWALRKRQTRSTSPSSRGVVEACSRRSTWQTGSVCARILVSYHTPLITVAPEAREPLPLLPEVHTFPSHARLREKNTVQKSHLDPQQGLSHRKPAHNHKGS